MGELGRRHFTRNQHWSRVREWEKPGERLHRNWSRWFSPSSLLCHSVRP